MRAIGEFVAMPYYASQVMRANRAHPTKFEKIKYNSHRRQYVCVYEPVGNVRRCKQVLMLLHGGSWRMGSPEFYKAFAHQATLRGYTVVVATYRFVPRYNYYDIMNDAQQALLATQNYLKQKGRAGQKILMIGESAGGSMAAHLVYDTLAQKVQGYDQSIFSGFMSIAGAVNTHDMIDFKGIRDYCGAPGSQMFADADILPKLQEKETLPFLVLHGDKDIIVDYRSSVAFVNALKSKQNNNAELITIPDCGHMKLCFGWYLVQNNYVNIVFDWIHEQEKLQLSQLSN
jgi:acetyl esterase/lipase